MATGDAPVFALESAGPISLEQLETEYPQVFGPGVGRLDGRYCIILDNNVAPVQHPPRRAPIPLQDVLKRTMDDLVRQNILAPVQRPTRVSSLMAVPKKDGKLRICLDPRDLNRAIRREHYLLPTIKDIAARLSGAKVFTSGKDSGM